MIKVYYDKGVRLECTPDIAINVINATSLYNEGVGNRGGNAIIAIGDSNVDKINKDLVPFKSHIKVDDSFKKWKIANDARTGRNTQLILKVGVVFTTIVGPSGTIPHKDIEDVCKYFFKPAVRQKRFQDKKWDGFIHLYKKWIKRFPTGLLDDVRHVLDGKGVNYRVEFMYDEEPPRQFNWRAKHLFDPSEDQKEALDACIARKRGVCKAPTGYG